jgi:hypothetical protein
MRHSPPPLQRGALRRLLPLSLLLGLTGQLHASDFSALQGYWQCKEAGMNYSLQFLSSNQLVYNGQTTNYQLAPNILYVEEEYGTVGYFYQLQGGALTILSPDGSVSQCQKGQKPPSVATPAPQQPQAYPQTGGQPGQVVVPGQNWPIYARPQGNISWNSSDPQALVYKFAGRWDHVTSNTLTNLYLKPDGSYEDAYEAGYSGTFEDQGGYQTGAWGATGTEQSGGYWTIQGTLERGTITLTGHDGSRTVLNYRVHVKNGEYYGGEYFFNGRLHSVNYIYR